jgi:hypothetical protein
MRKLKIFGVGFEPTFIRNFLVPVARRTGIEFTFGLVGDSRRIPVLAPESPKGAWLSLSKSGKQPLPAPDYGLLASLESVGVPTIASMLRGDRVLRNRPSHESFAYATLVARRLIEAFDETNPDLVLGNFDSAHSALGLAVAKSRGIPWVAMAFTVIPQELMGFCKAMTPEALLPIERPVDEHMHAEARKTLNAFRSRNVKVFAYRPPESLSQRARQSAEYARNLARRIGSGRSLGVDQFTYPTIGERIIDLTRRSINGFRLPADKMVTAPPNAPFVFFPLHMAPESSVDTWAPMYQNQLELAFQLSLAVPANLELVVKLHFSDPDNYSREELLRLMQLPRVVVAHPSASSRSFIERAALVAGIHGTALLEASLLGKPVLLFGDSPYQHFPRSERAQRPDEFHGQIRRMLDLHPPNDAEIVYAFAAYMARYMPSRHNDWNRPITDEELNRVADCYRALQSYVEAPGIRNSWYNEPPFIGQESSAGVSPCARSPRPRWTL